MPRPKTVTLKGAAARAFFIQRAGQPPKSEEEALLSIVSSIHVYMKLDKTTDAVELLKTAINHGPMKTADALSKVAQAGDIVRDSSSEPRRNLVPPKGRPRLGAPHR